MKKLSKLFKSNSAKIAENQIAAIASTTGNIDRGGDVLMPGCFKNAVLRDFLANGWVDCGHEWGEPIAMPVSASMIGDELHSVAEFHSTEDAQRMRTKVLERIEKGLSVSVSIGFMPDYSKNQYFESGAELLKWLPENGYSEDQFDLPSIKAWKGSCRAIRSVLELFEWSIVAVGMNRNAKAVAVKSFSTDDDSPGVSLSEHLEHSLGEVEELVKRLSSVQDARLAKGGRLSLDHKPRVEQMLVSLNTILAAMSQPGTEEKADRIALLNRKALDVRARLVGAGT